MKRCGGAPNDDCKVIRCLLPQGHLTDHESWGDGWRWQWPRTGKNYKRTLRKLAKAAS